MNEGDLQVQLNLALNKEKELLETKEKYETRFKKLEEKITKLQKTINSLKEKNRQ